MAYNLRQLSTTTNYRDIGDANWLPRSKRQRSHSEDDETRRSAMHKKRLISITAAQALDPKTIKRWKVYTLGSGSVTEILVRVISVRPDQNPQKLPLGFWSGRPKSPGYWSGSRYFGPGSRFTLG